MAWVPGGSPMRAPRTSRPCGVSRSNTVQTTLPFWSFSSTVFGGTEGAAGAAGVPGVGDAGAGVGICPRARPAVSSTATSPRRNSRVIAFLLAVEVLNLSVRALRPQVDAGAGPQVHVQLDGEGARAPVRGRP